MNYDGYDLDVMTRTIFGEVRGASQEDQIAVAWTIINRASDASKHPHFGDGSIASTCLSPWQFSCWIVGDPNRTKIFMLTDEDPEYNAMKRIAGACLDGALSDPTGGATYYYARNIDVVPKWAENLKPCFETDFQLYFKGVL